MDNDSTLLEKYVAIGLALITIIIISLNILFVY